MNDGGDGHGGTGVWPVYLINLADARERRERSARWFARAKIAYERIEAVNGWNLTDGEIAQVYDEGGNRRKGKYPLVKPQIGLFLSHIGAWSRIAAGAQAGGFVFEDDFATEPSLPEVLRLISQDTPDWDLVKLYSRKKPLFPLSRRPLGERHEIVVPYRVPNFNIAYGITKTAAARLANTVVPFSRQCDETLKYFWETNLRVSLVWPLPVRIDEETTKIGAASTARRSANRRTGWARFRQAARNASYQFDYQARLHFHRLPRMLRPSP